MGKYTFLKLLAAFLLGATFLGLSICLLIALKVLPSTFCVGVCGENIQKTSSTTVSDTQSSHPTPENKVDFFQEAINQAQKKDSSLTYLLYTPQYNDNWKLFVHDGGENFLFQYPGKAPWGRMRFTMSDLTANDSPEPLGIEVFKAITSYSFCSDHYCDENKAEGFGFELTLYNAHYQNRQSDPKFTKDGGTYVTENSDYVYVYKPFQLSSSCDHPINDLAKKVCANQQDELNEAVKELFKSFKIY